MPVKSDKWIREMAQTRGMIDPFTPGQVKRNGTAALSLRAKDYSSRFPKIVVENA